MERLARVDSLLLLREKSTRRWEQALSKQAHDLIFVVYCSSMAQFIPLLLRHER